MTATPPAPRSIAQMIVENAVRLGLGAVLAAMLWVLGSIDRLRDDVADLQARYTSLRERTDESSRQLTQRLDRVELQISTINSHTVEIIRTLARMEARIDARDRRDGVTYPPVNP